MLDAHRLWLISKVREDSTGTNRCVRSSDRRCLRRRWYRLIEQALENNTDLNTARINIEKSQQALQAARLAYLPSLYFTPQGTLSSFDQSKASKSYNLQMQTSVDLDLFGSITSKKRAAKAVLMQAQMSEEATRANLVSTLAQQYYRLMLLRRDGSGETGE